MHPFRTARRLAAASALAAGCGVLLFGGELFSYASTAFSSSQQAVVDRVPIDFEIQRARDLLDGVIPELHANLAEIAREEIELERLEAEVVEGERGLAARRAALARLRDGFEEGADTAALERAAAGFEQAGLALSSRKRLAEKRRETLAAATTQLETTRGKKALLEDRIDALAAQVRLMEVTSAGADSGLALDRSAFDRTQKLVDGLQKRMDVAERVLAKEAAFAPEPAAADPVDLLARVDAMVAE